MYKLNVSDGVSTRIDLMCVVVCLGEEEVLFPARPLGKRNAQNRSGKKQNPTLKKKTGLKGHCHD